MKRLLNILFCLVAVLAAAGTLRGQESQRKIEELNAQIRKAEEEISISQRLLDKNRKDQKVNQNELKLIRSRINNRNAIISSLTKQIAIINGDISAKNRNIEILLAEEQRLKREYGEMVYAAYKNSKTNTFMMFLFASRDFNDATRRVAYMRRLNQVRRAKMEEIGEVCRRVNAEIDTLNSRRTQLDKTKDTRREELAKLGKDETGYRQAVDRLKKNESKIAAEIRQKQKVKERAQQEIRKIIAEESRRNSATKRTAAEEQALTVLTGRFDQNAGKLPYPVRGGVIVDHYGVHAHPTQKGLTVNNKGVNIAGERGAQVRCVFEGTVTRVFFFQGLNNSVMVRHGNYITVYSNLASVAVKPNDKVSLNQVLGTLSSGDDSDDYVLHFEIWKETENLNPERWLSR